MDSLIFSLPDAARTLLVRHAPKSAKATNLRKQIATRRLKEAVKAEQQQKKKNQKEPNFLDVNNSTTTDVAPEAEEPEKLKKSNRTPASANVSKDEPPMVGGDFTDFFFICFVFHICALIQVLLGILCVLERKSESQCVSVFQIQ